MHTLKSSYKKYRYQNTLKQVLKNTFIFKIIFVILLFITVKFLPREINNIHIAEFINFHIDKALNENINLSEKIESFINYSILRSAKTKENTIYQEETNNIDAIYSNIDGRISLQLFNNEIRIDNSDDRINNFENFKTSISIQNKLIYPLKNIQIASKFGYRVHPVNGTNEFHKGIDFKAGFGEKILAVCDGTVIFCGTDKFGLGNYIKIKHADDLISIYGHCSKILVNSGKVVKQGEEIAEVGSSGLSTGPHLHFGLYINNVAVDPLKYFIK